MVDEENSSKPRLDIPSLQALQAFQRVAERRSFTAAARDLGRTPSAISHAIRDLEARLGATLFLREGRQATLTSAGAELLPSVDKGLAELEAGVRRLQRGRRPHLLRISALPLFTSSVLLPNLAAFERRFPDLELHIETANAYADVANGAADAAVRFGAAQVEGLAVVPLIRVFGVPVCAPFYLERSPPLLGAEDVQKHTLIHVAQQPNAWTEWVVEQGAPPPPNAADGLTFDSYLGALDAAKRGLGLALAMGPIIEGFPGYGREIAPAAPALRRPKKSGGGDKTFNFVCRKSEYESRKIQSALRWLKESLAVFEDADGGGDVRPA